MTSDPSFRAPNPTNLQMAQLWASHLHEGNVQCRPRAPPPAYQTKGGGLNGQSSSKGSKVASADTSAVERVV